MTTEQTDKKLIAKRVVDADLVCVTGLRIGAAADEVQIGGLDNPVIRNPLTDEPYIPGSSLKGKLRHLCEWAHGEFLSKGEPTKDPKTTAGGLFGVPADAQGAQHPTVLTVRDAFLTEESREELKNANPLLTELKSENNLNRITSEAVPRPMERVPAGAAFWTQFVLDVYDTAEENKHLEELLVLMRLLEDSGLGGSVSRGSGRVRFQSIRITRRPINFYFDRAEERTDGPYKSLTEAVSSLKVEKG